MNNFAYFIASYGKPYNMPTLEFLRKLDAKYPVYIVIGTDDPKIDDYKKVFPEHLLIFDKSDYIDKVDDLGVYAKTHKVCTYSRLAVLDFAKQLEIKYVGYLFDDIESIQLRYQLSNGKIASTKNFQIDRMIDLYINLLNSSKDIYIVGPPNSSFYIGVNSKMVDRYSTRYGNMFIYDVDRLLQPYKSSILEDMSIILYNNLVGKMSICPFGMQVNCRAPKVSSDCYKGMNVSEYYQHLVIIGQQQVNLNRPEIHYKNFTPKIISDKYRR